jgi:hypothetical protein
MPLPMTFAAQFEQAAAEHALPAAFEIALGPWACDQPVPSRDGRHIFKFFLMGLPWARHGGRLRRTLEKIPKACSLAIAATGRKVG